MINAQIVYHLSHFTDLLEPHAVQLLGWVTDNRRKKISSLSRQKQLRLLFYAIYMSDRTSQYKVFCRLRLDRSYIRGIAVKFLEEVAEYPRLYEAFIRNKATDAEMFRMSEIESRSNCDRSILNPLIQNLRSLLDLNQEFRDQIMKKYYKFIFTLVRKNMRATSRQLDDQDLMQNYISATLKALDRYDSKKGALTSYIRYWILNNQQSAEESPEYGIAYDIPSTQRLAKANGSSDCGEDNFSVSLDELMEEEGDSKHFGAETHAPDKMNEGMHAYLAILSLSKAADPVGVGRLSLRIEEYFEVETVEKMRQYMQKHKIPCRF